MKKYKIVLSVFILSFILFNSNANLALGANCAPGDLFDSATGQACYTGASNSLLFTEYLKVGSKGEEVKTLQQILTNANFSPGAADGVFGSKTRSAVVAFQANMGFAADGIVGPITSRALIERSDIRPLPAPCPLEEVDGFVRHVCPTPEPTPIPEVRNFMNVISPNGGEAWAKGTVKTIEWRDNTPIPLFACQEGTDCFYPPQLYDINLVAYYPPCTETMCPLFPIPVPRPIVKSVSGASYMWTVGKMWDSNDAAPSDAYLIKVCRTGSSACDSSDNYFKITNGSTTTPFITVLSPNGGETWTKKTNQAIKWQDNTPFSCPPIDGVACPAVMPVFQYDIKLASYYPPCTSHICPMYPYRESYTIAKSVSGSSYVWTVGYGRDYDGVPNGSYTIEVCQTGTTICDSSDKYFTITSGKTDTQAPIISSLSPTSGAVSTQVAVYGSGFTPTGNRVIFGQSGDINGTGYTSNGNIIAFMVPTYSSNTGIANKPGNYEVSVINANGTSNAVDFTVTSSTAPVPTTFTRAVTSPSSGSSWAVGSIQTIRWTFPSNTSAVGLRLARNGERVSGAAGIICGGSTGVYGDVSGEFCRDTGAFDWVLDDSLAPGSGYSVQLISSGQVIAESGKFDIIISGASFNVISPNSQSSVRFGSDLTINWTNPANFTGNVDVAVYQVSRGFNGLSYIAKNVPAGWLHIVGGLVHFTWSVSAGNNLPQSNGNGGMIVPGQAIIIISDPANRNLVGFSNSFAIQ